MKNSFLFQIFATVVCLTALFQSCIDPIPFERRKEENILVVDGKVNLQDSVQKLSLTRTEIVGRSARFPPEVGAQVQLLEEGSVAGDYLETEPGIYTIFNFKPQVGKSYHIEISLANGERYASQPDVMPRHVPLDSAYFTYMGGRNLTIYARTLIPEQGQAPYLRWRIRHVYQVSDLHCGELDAIAICYYEANRATDNQLVPLLDGGELSPGATVVTPIVEVPVIDSIFGEITFFTVFQETMSAATFQYWQKVNTLITQTGSLFDAPPGQIRGNIYHVSDPEAPVLGIFYAASEDFAYIKTLASDFPALQLSPYCGFPGFPPVPFPFPQCCYCRFGIEQPAYWR